ncbi:ABC1 family protein [Tothia fuscella]|uniref:ABC1 family protein n=1 Tax=Tothia fuscella TaxID=1048955 RepID=A0A9P4NFP1_9PEZI|nr:ABC1 family protein [Tothia fuscella]
MSLRTFTPLFRPWTCRTCIQRSTTAKTSFPNWKATYATQTIRNAVKPKKKRRRVLLATAGGGTAVLAGVVAVSDDAKHIARAAQRTGRVVSTLFVCINDYRVTLKLSTTTPPDDYTALLSSCHKRCALRTLSAMQANGSIFIKLGQHLSSLNYLLPPEWCDTFIPLQDKCPVSPLASIEEMCLKDTGQPLSHFFTEFEEVPIGAASLAQVHRAVVRETGEHVAVKVQHPSLDEWAPLDLKLTHFTFATLKRFFPEYDLTWLSEEMEISLPQELNFEREGQNAIRAREYFAHIEELPVIIPRVLWAKRRILVMEFVSGHRPDDLNFLDGEGIDRDEVSAALARIFNEMIFGREAPLHCDPHGGNIAIRKKKPGYGQGKRNFDVILYDHGLYRDIPLSLRRSYAKLWLAVLEEDEGLMRKYAHEVSGIDDKYFPLFASAITGRDYTVLANGGGGVAKARTSEERESIGSSLVDDGLLSQLVQLLGKVPRVLLLILKTNDLTRSLDENLHTRQGSARTFLILARYASRTVYEEQMDFIKGSILWPPNAFSVLRAWLGYKRLELKLSSYELYLDVRRLLGFGPLVVV